MFDALLENEVKSVLVTYPQEGQACVTCLPRSTIWPAWLPGLTSTCATDVSRSVPIKYLMPEHEHKSQPAGHPA